MFKVGDEVRCVNPSNGDMTLNAKYKVLKTGLTTDSKADCIEVLTSDGPQKKRSDRFELIKETNMLDSVKEYLKQHKDIIITIGVVLVVDHLIFGGAFREKVKSLIDGLINKAEKQLKDK